MDIPKSRLAKMSWPGLFLIGYLALASYGVGAMQSQKAQPTLAEAPAARPVGTVKSISGNSITLASDAGSDVNVVVSEASKIVRIAPGQKDLKDAMSLQLQDMQVGDRILVRGKLSADGVTVIASSIIAVKKLDLAEKQTSDRDAWQRQGVGGLVSDVNAADGTIHILVAMPGEKKKIAVHVSNGTILRRYAPGSVNFGEARPAPLNEIKPGDQLRARGTRSADGSEISADEIVSGSFRNISGNISAIDTAAATITLQDLATKQVVTVIISPESQIRNLPPAMAQHLARTLKGAPANGHPAPAAMPASRPGESTIPVDMNRERQAGDLSQLINRLPPTTISDLHKGDAVMIVATEVTQKPRIMAITLLSGVEPILQASPQGEASTILAPWSLSGTPGGDSATP